MYVIFGYFLVEIRPNPVDPHPISLVMAVFELNSTFLNYWELWGGYEGLFVTIFFRLPEGRFCDFYWGRYAPTPDPRKVFQANQKAI